MFKLNPEKEKELTTKYKFYQISSNTKFMAYKYAGITICPTTNPKFSGRVVIHSYSRAVQDKLYELIKDHVLILGPNDNNEEKLSKLKLQLKRLETQISELENKEE